MGYTYIGSLINLFMTDPTYALLVVLARLLSMCIAVSFHEWAHAFAAYKLGDPTAKNLGRMSLDPLKHIDVVGLICFVLFGIGWAKPVIVNSKNLKNYRRDDILISIAGVVMNLLLSFVFFGIYFGTVVGFGVTNEIFMLVMQTIITMNISFAVFNLIPIPPLDGYHVLSSIFIRRSYKVVQFFQRYGFILLLILVVSGAISWLISTVMNALWGLYFDFFMLFVV